MKRPAPCPPSHPPHKPLLHQGTRPLPVCPAQSFTAETTSKEFERLHKESQSGPREGREPEDIQGGRGVPGRAGDDEADPGIRRVGGRTAACRGATLGVAFAHPHRPAVHHHGQCQPHHLQRERERGSVNVHVQGQRRGQSSVDRRIRIQQCKVLSEAECRGYSAALYRGHSISVTGIRYRGHSAER